MLLGKVFALDEGGSNSNLRKDLDEPHSHQCDPHNSKGILGNKSCQNGDENELQSHLTKYVYRLPAKGCYEFLASSHLFDYRQIIFFMLDSSSIRF